MRLSRWPVTPIWSTRRGRGGDENWGAAMGWRAMYFTAIPE
jgi:hypothetical protein